MVLRDEAVKVKLSISPHSTYIPDILDVAGCKGSSRIAITFAKFCLLVKFCSSQRRILHILGLKNRISYLVRFERPSPRQSVARFAMLVLATRPQRWLPEDVFFIPPPPKYEMPQPGDNSLKPENVFPEGSMLQCI